MKDRGVLSLMASTDRTTVLDTVTGMNWLANANLVADKSMRFDVKGINPDGSMTWEAAMNWVAALNNVDNGKRKPKGYLFHDDWALPITPNIEKNTTPHYGNLADGFDFTKSDLGELFYDEFGDHDGESIASVDNSNTESFQNIQPYYYRSSKLRNRSEDFSFASGFVVGIRISPQSFLCPRRAGLSQSGTAVSLLSFKERIHVRISSLRRCDWRLLPATHPAWIAQDFSVDVDSPCREQLPGAGRHQRHMD